MTGKLRKNAAGATRGEFNGVVRLLRFVIFRYKKEISSDSRPPSFINWTIHYETPFYQFYIHRRSRFAGPSGRAV